MEQYYSLHDIVTFKIVAGSLPRRLKLEYANFESIRIENTDFTVYLGNFSPSKKDCQVLDNIYFVDRDYFYTEGSYKTGKWHLELTGFEQGNFNVRLSTNIVGSIFSDMFICAYVIDPLIKYVLNRKGYCAVHASAVSRNGSAFLFPAQSGAGKTTTAAYFTREGFDFLGDDFVILHKGRIFSYLTPLNIFAYNLNQVINDNFNTMDRVVIKMKNALYKATSGYIKIFSKLNPADVFRTTESAELKVVYFLMPGESFKVSDMPRVEMLKRLAVNWDMELSLLNHYLLEYAYAFPSSNVADTWNTCNTILEEGIPKDIKCFRVEVPRKYTRETFVEIKKLVTGVS
ncbi:hypothetical protein ACFLUF_02335 [Chloroflexota bacterium]